MVLTMGQSGMQNASIEEEKKCISHIQLKNGNGKIILTRGEIL